MHRPLDVLLAIDHLAFLSAKEKLNLAQAVAGTAALVALSREAVGEIVGRSLAETWRPARAVQTAAAELRNLTRCGVGCIFYGDGRYPPQLREIYDPPFLLFYRGAPPNNDAPSVAVVGTRRPTSLGRTAAFRLGMELAGLGITVVSGLARGIDVEAHEGCLAAGGRALAVLGNGLSDVYPPSSRDLAHRILAAGGCLLSELPSENRAERYNFPERNRIISGLARSVVVVQAPAKSGALITADHGLEQGRDLFVHADGIGGVAGRGGQVLSEQGAPVIGCAQDILQDWAWKAGVARLCGPLEAVPPEGLRGNPGRRLARLLELELTGGARLHNGTYYGSWSGRGSGAGGVDRTGNA